MTTRRDVLLGLLAAPLVSGCARSAVAQEAPLRVGVLFPLTGALGESGRHVAAATQFAIDLVNGEVPEFARRDGRVGVGGRRVEPVLADGTSNDARFAAAARELVAGEGGVRAVFGCWTSSSRRAVLPVIEEHEAFLFYPVQFEGLERSDHALYLGALPNQQVLPALRWGVSKLGPKVALIGSDYVFPRVAHAIARDQLAAMGLQVAWEGFLPLDGPDLTGQAAAAASAILESGASFVASTLNGLPGNEAFLRALEGAPARPPVLSFSVAEPEAEALLARGASVEGDYAAWLHLAGSSDPSAKRFRAAFGRWRERAGEPGSDAISDPMAQAIAAVLLWAAAVEQVPAAADDPAQLRAALAGRSVIGPQGEVHVDAHLPNTWGRPVVGRFDARGQLRAVHQAVALEPPRPFPGYRDEAAWMALLDASTGDHG